jgi:hypothetical protein
VPVGAQFGRVAPETGGQAGRVGGAERGGLGDRRPAHRDAEDVGLNLHGQAVGGYPAVHLEHLQADPRVLLHGLDHVPGLVADGLQGGAGQVRPGVEPGQADDRAARVGPPVRREQPGEGRHEVGAAGVVDLRGQRLALRRRGDDAELVTQPLHGRARHRDRPLEREDGRLGAELEAHRGEQAALGPDDLCAGVQQQEVARAVRVLGLAGSQADLPDGGGLLVAQGAGDRQLGAERALR